MGVPTANPGIRLPETCVLPTFDTTRITRGLMALGLALGFLGLTAVASFHSHADGGLGAGDVVCVVCATPAPPGSPAIAQAPTAPTIRFVPAFLHGPPAAAGHETATVLPRAPPLLHG